MWTQIIKSAKELFTISERSTRNKEEIAKLRTDFDTLEDKVDQLTTAIHLLANDNMRMKEEIKNNREAETRERENLALRLENEMLKFERRLPSGDKQER